MNLNVSWVLEIDPDVYKILRKFPKKDAKRILFAIWSLPVDPFEGDIEKMKGEENIWRRRIGAYRIFYEIIPREKIISVYHVERRTSKTY
jgi:mRNA interferase RelE/StbE